MFLIILIIIIGACALIGLIVGLCSGVSKCKTWAMDVLCATAVSIPVSRRFSFSNVYINAAFVVGLSLGVLLVCMAISAGVKGFLKHRWAPFNRICGGVVLALKGASIACIILAPLFMIVEITNFSTLTSFCSPVLSSRVWSFIKPYILDYLLIALMSFFLKEGYKTGILGALTALIKLALYVGAAYLAYRLAFRSQGLISAAESLANNVGFLGTIANYTTAVSSGLNAAFFAKCLITVGLCVLFWILVAVFNFMLSRIVDRLHDVAAVGVIDGVLGALVMMVGFMAVLMLIGGLVGSLSQLDMMSRVNAYASNGGLAQVFYDNNPIMQISFFANLDLSKYFS